MVRPTTGNKRAQQLARLGRECMIHRADGNPQHWPEGSNEHLSIGTEGAPRSSKATGLHDSDGKRLTSTEFKR